MNFVKSVRKQYGNPDSHPFFLNQVYNRETVIIIPQKMFEWDMEFFYNIQNS